MKICGNVVDIHNREIYPAEISVINGKIQKIDRVDKAPEIFILPGLIDAHIHIESSLVTPGSFALTAVKHGTTGVVSDPHEIANVLGIKGVDFMIDDARKVPMRFWFGASPCVPATGFESNGAEINHIEVGKLLNRPEINYMAEMMNFPGVLSDDKEVYRKLDIARNLGKPVDGHAPGLRGESLRKYVQAGISTDHECSTLDEAKEKISLGMKILIREGSAARNLDSLKDLFKTDPHMVMLCSDDLHPQMLQVGHINKLIAKLISEGFDEFDVIRSATLNPVNHYKLDAGLLQAGQNADLIMVDSLIQMNLLDVWISGRKVYSDGLILFDYTPGKAINNFNSTPINGKAIRVENKPGRMRIIKAFDGELLTREEICLPGISRLVKSDIKNDILKIVVKERYNNLPVAVGFIKGFGLKRGAFASSIAHDSHNIVAVGTNDRDIIRCINEIVKLKGGLSTSSDGRIASLQLNIGGIMTTRPCEEVAEIYENLNNAVRELGSSMKAPFMTLSFMSLLVIPELKIGDQGLFNVDEFRLTSLFVE